MELFLEKVENTILALAVGVVLIAGLTVVLSCGTPAYVWLQTAEVPQRDLFWLSADVFCPQGGVGGWQGKDLCREDSAEFTEWAGLNKILNYVMDIHIGIIAIVLAATLIFVLMIVADYVADAKAPYIKARMEREAKELKSLMSNDDY